MAIQIIHEPSRTLMEFRLLPSLTTKETTAGNVSTITPFVYGDDLGRTYNLNIPIISAAMQSVSGVQTAVQLAKLGGCAVIYCSQPIEEQAKMVAAVKHHKAGFVTPTCVSPDLRISELHELRMKTGYNVFPITNAKNRLLGIITRNDYDKVRHGNLLVSERMIPIDKLIVGVNTLNLKAANSILMESHQSVLPIVTDDQELLYLVFRRDIEDHLDNPHQVVDERKRLFSAAAINTHDFKERVPLLIDAGTDVLCIDSSDGYTSFQQETLLWLRENYPSIPVIGGNVITAEGFRYLVESGARAVKVGMGSGSICITQEQKGTGRGLATAIIKVVEERDSYFNESGKYIPICADGGIGNSKDIAIALALGADYIMMGRYFARMDEAPTEKVMINNRIMKPYWGEGSPRARDWQLKRYNQSLFAEGVEGFVEYAGRMKDNIEVTIAKIKSTMSTCGVSSIDELHRKAELEMVSSLSIREGKVHDIFVPQNNEFINDDDRF